MDLITRPLARELAEKHQKQEKIQRKVFRKIRRAALRGQFSTLYFGDLNQITLQALLNNGFVYNKHTQFGDGDIYYTILWK